MHFNSADRILKIALKYFSSVIQVTELDPADTLLDSDSVCYWGFGADNSYVTDGFDPTETDIVVLIDPYPYSSVVLPYHCVKKRWPTYIGMDFEPVSFDLIDDQYDFQAKIDIVVLF